MEKNQKKIHEIGFTLLTSSNKKIKELEKYKIEDFNLVENEVKIFEELDCNALTVMKKLLNIEIELSEKIKAQYEIRETALKMISDSIEVDNDTDIDLILDLIRNF